MIALVRSPLQERGRLGVGSGHNQTGHHHDVKLEARGIEPLDLLVHSDEYLPALMPALLRAGLLILDVVARDPDLDEAANEVPDMRVAAVPRVGVGDDERAVVDLGSRITLSLAQAGAREALIP